MENDFPKVVPIRGTIGFSYLVLENPCHAVLIDCVFGCGARKLERTLAENHLQSDCLKAIILTHGHLDHCINADIIQRQYHVPIICPQQDEAYLSGKARYSSFNKIGGALEAAGRWLWRYHCLQEVIFLDDTSGESVPFAPCLRRIPFPGHTPGHSGYFIPGKDILLAGDLFAGNGLTTHAPPRIFTANRKMALQSIRKAANLEAKQVFVCHTFNADGTAGAAALRQLAKRIFS